MSKDKSHLDPNIVKSIAQKPDVPFTSIYSKTDGVVSWQASLEEETDISQNIEILGASHTGLGHNAKVLFVIANILSQPPNNWRLYKDR